MLTFKEITLEDQATIQNFLKQEDFLISDISFINLYLWRKARKIAYTIISDCLIIQTTYPKHTPFYFFPIGNGDKKAAILTLKEYANNTKTPLEFHSLQQYALDFFETHFQGSFEAKLNRDRSDYIYNIPELIALNGRKYHKKKNHLNKFLQSYPDFIYEEITKKNTGELLDTWKIWFDAQKNPSQGLIHENEGIIDVLQNWESLKLKGGIIKINQNIIAFSFGEEINNKMALIHIEKANAQYAGAYQIINQQFLKNAFNHLEYANREEDLGIEGLRKAKMSYHPIFLVEKYEIIFHTVF